MIDKANWLGLVALAGLFAAPALASETFHACAAQAASPWEPDYADTGRTTAAMDATAAISACLTALETLR